LLFCDRIADGLFAGRCIASWSLERVGCFAEACFGFAVMEDDGFRSRRLPAATSVRQLGDLAGCAAVDAFPPAGGIKATIRKRCFVNIYIEILETKNFS